MSASLRTRKRNNPIILLTCILVTAVTSTSAQTVIIDKDHSATLIQSFTCHREQEDVLLSWVFENEPDAKWFIVERSLDNHQFVPIGKIEIRHRRRPSPYRFTDPNLVDGAHYYYRLQQVNDEGLNRYSETISLENKDAQLQVLSDLTTVRINYLLTSPGEQVTVQVCTTDGIVLFEQKDQLAAGRNRLCIALTDLKSGKYVLKVLDKQQLPEHVASFAKL
jgi:hypothetical protein